MQAFNIFSPFLKFFFIYLTGYGAPQQPPVDPQVQQWFNAVDQDRSGQITAGELSKALVNGNWSNFSEEACRMMIGKITF